MFKLPTLLFDPWRPCRFERSIRRRTVSWLACVLNVATILVAAKQNMEIKYPAKVQMDSKTSLCLPSSSLDFSSNPLSYHSPKTCKFFGQVFEPPNRSKRLTKGTSHRLSKASDWWKRADTSAITWHVQFLRVEQLKILHHSLTCSKHFPLWVAGWPCLIRATPGSGSSAALRCLVSCCFILAASCSILQHLAAFCRCAMPRAPGLSALGCVCAHLGVQHDA